MYEKLYDEISKLPDFGFDDFINYLLTNELKTFTTDFLEHDTYDGSVYLPIADVIKEHPHDIDKIAEAFSKLSDTHMSRIILMDSTIGICLQELGALTKEQHPSSFEYISNRGGVGLGFMSISKTNDVKIMSIRGMIRIFKFIDRVKEEAFDEALKE